jgi:putative ABC transport system permease protein
VFALLYRTSMIRRAWPLAEAAIILGLIVALGVSLAVFASSYDAAKAADARYVVGSDLRITPDPAGGRAFSTADAAGLVGNGITAVIPVVYGAHNVILRSNRTSDIANLAALDPVAYARIAPLQNSHFPDGSAAATVQALADDPDAILLSTHMSGFLRAPVGTRLRVLLARGTPEQTEVELQIIGLFDRLPGFPDGADALMNLTRLMQEVPAAEPAFFLARTTDQTGATLALATAALEANLGPAAHIDTRLTALAKDQSSLAALNIDGLLRLDSGFSLAMGAVTVAIFVFGLLLQRRREYVTLRALGLHPAAIRGLIGAEAGTATLAGCAIGAPVGLIMAVYFINVLRPLFVLDPAYHLNLGSIAVIVVSVLGAALIAALAASALVNRLNAMELLRDD